MTHKRSRGRQRGVAAVEFTIALPVLLFLFLAVTELGRAFLQYSRLTYAVRDSARYVASQALLGSTGTVNLDAQTIAAARSLVVYGTTAGSGTPLLPGLAPGNITVRDLGGGNVSVLATYAYQPMIGSALPDVLGTGQANTSFTLRAEVVMRAIS